MTNEHTMDCCNICRISNRSPLVTCSVCKLPFHMKCVAPKMTIKDFDTFLATPGFFFYCEKHCDLSVHKLLKRLATIEEKFKRCFSEINEELKDFHGALHAGNLNCEATIDNAISSKALLPTVASASKMKNSGKNSCVAEKCPKESTLSLSVEPIQPDLSSPNISTTPYQSPMFDSTPTSFEPNDILINQVNIAPSQITRPTFAEMASVNSSAGLTCHSDANSAITTDGVPSLHFISPNKNVFLSGVHPSTTEVNIKSYIDFNTHKNTNLTIRKMKFNDVRPYASFVINVGRDPELFNIINNRSFWPQNAIVREFDQFFRKRNPPLKQHA